MAFDANLLPLVRKNLVITPQFKMLLNEHGVAVACETIRSHFPDLGVDIIVVDPLRNVFDGGEGDAGENDNAAMLFFLQQRLDALRDAVNSGAGIILVHHTRKIQKKQLEEDPLQALFGAGSLRGYYTTDLIMFQSDENQSYRQLIFGLRNGPRLRSKVIDKIDVAWHEMEYSFGRLVNRDYGQKLDAERRRKRDVILEIIYEEARVGCVYTMNQFCQAFENRAGLGGKDTIRGRLDVLSTKGYAKFFRGADTYGLNSPSRTKYGFLCVEDMHLGTDEEMVVHIPVKSLPSSKRSIQPITNVAKRRLSCLSRTFVCGFMTRRIRHDKPPLQAAPKNHSYQRFHVSFWQDSSFGHPVSFQTTKTGGKVFYFKA